MLVARLGLALVLLLPVVATAEEPKGLLADVVWSASREEVIEKFVKEKCNWSISRDSVKEQSIACRDYHLMEMTPVLVMLHFSQDDRFQGYSISPPSRLYVDFKDAMIAKVGPPLLTVKPPHEGLTWRWPSGTTAVLVQRGVGGSPSLVVMTKGAQAEAGKAARDRQEKLKRGF